MTPEQRAVERAREDAAVVRRRIALIIELAPDLECAECGRQVEEAAALTIDHVDGKAWNARKISSRKRVARYWREFKAGVAMRALCGLCNSISGGFWRHGLSWSASKAEDDEVPF